MEGIRINKYLSEAGACSRREADRLIELGEVTVDGRPARVAELVSPGQIVCVRGQRVTNKQDTVLLALNKPRGIVCTTAKEEKNNVIDFLHYPKRIYPVGRLDKTSEGLLLLTNNGELVNKMMRAGNWHEKEYVVTVDKPVTEDFIRKMAAGVYLEELSVTTRPCEVERLAPQKFRMVLTQGLNRQIRRMCEAFGYRVKRLVRVRIMNISLGTLPVGKYREVTGEEYEELLRLLKHSSNAPVCERGEESQPTERV